MEQYVGLDVSLRETSLCVVDQTGTTLWQGKCATPESIAAVLARRAPGATRIGLESGLLSTWHWHALKALGLAGGLPGCTPRQPYRCGLATTHADSSSMPSNGAHDRRPLRKAVSSTKRSRRADVSIRYTDAWRGRDRAVGRQRRPLLSQRSPTRSTACSRPSLLGVALAKVAAVEFATLEWVDWFNNLVSASRSPASRLPG